MNKVFCIGMYKTGTTTMGAAFQVLGYNTFLGGWPKDKMIFDRWFQTPDEWNNYDDIIKEKTEAYDAFEDYPWMFCYKKCHEWYPDAKFILLQRDANEVAESDLNMWRKEGVAESDLPPAQKFIDRYERQFKEASEYFKDNPNFLIMNISEGWTTLCPFLDKKTPLEEFPHSNKGQYQNQHSYGPHYNI